MAYPDYSGDHASVDGTELLTLTKVSGGAPLTNGVGKKCSVTVADIQAGGAAGVSASTCVFILWLGTFADYRPVNGDRLTRVSPAETWQVISEGIRGDDEQARVVCMLMRANA